MVQRIYTDPHSPDIFRIKVINEISPYFRDIPMLTNLRAPRRIRVNSEKLLIARSRSLLVSCGRRRASTRVDMRQRQRLSSKGFE
jgi:hypothetical protein